jgi:hypothetical protein
VFEKGKRPSTAISVIKKVGDSTNRGTKPTSNGDLDDSVSGQRQPAIGIKKITPGIKATGTSTKASSDSKDDKKDGGAAEDKKKAVEDKKAADLKAKKDELERKKKAELDKKSAKDKPVINKLGTKKGQADDLDDPIEASLKERIAAGGITS